MKPFDSVSVEAAYELAQKELLEDRTRRVANAIRNLMNKRESALIKVAQFKAEVKKHEGIIASCEASLKEIKKGDWTKIPEPKETD